MVQSKSKHCHSIATANSQQVSVLCGVSTATPAVSPLIVVSKELPVGCNFQREGPCSECLLEIQRQCLCLSPHLYRIIYQGIHPNSRDQRSCLCVVI